METSFNLIDESCELTIARVTFTTDEEETYYFSELSSLQVLRELPVYTPILVTEVFSERHRIFQKTEAFKASKNVKDFLDIALPLVENGNFPCNVLTILIENQIKLVSRNDDDVHLMSSHRHKLHELIQKILIRQHYFPELLADVVNRPNLYHKLERPNKIVESYSSFDEVIDAM